MWRIYLLLICQVGIGIFCKEVEEVGDSDKYRIKNSPRNFRYFGYLPETDSDLGGEAGNPTETNNAKTEIQRFNNLMMHFMMPRIRKSCLSGCYCRSKISHQRFCCDCMTGPCFPGSSSVILYPTMDKVKMDQLHVGDQVATVLGGEVVGTVVVSFLDRRPDEIAEYVQVSVIDGATLSISSGHIVYVVDGNSMETMFSGDLKVGDHLMMMSSNGSVSPSEISHISRDLMKGAYVPLTSTGHLLVDSHLVSSYSSFPHDLSHLVFTPLRLGLLPESLTSAYVGMMKVLGRALLPSSLISTHHAKEIEKIKDGNNFDQQMALDRNNIKIGFCPLSA